MDDLAFGPMDGRLTVDRLPARLPVDRRWAAGAAAPGR